MTTNSNSPQAGEWRLSVKSVAAVLCSPIASLHRPLGGVQAIPRGHVLCMLICVCRSHASRCVFYVPSDWMMMMVMKVWMNRAFVTLCVKLTAQKMLWMFQTDWSASGPCCEGIGSQTACQTCPGLKWSSQHHQRSGGAL